MASELRTVTCAECGDVFLAKDDRAELCSGRCRQRRYVARQAKKREDALALLLEQSRLMQRRLTGEDVDGFLRDLNRRAQLALG